MIKNEAKIISALKKIILFYGMSTAKRIEQLFRNETAHFKSECYIITLGAGMQAAKGEDVLPFGWNSLVNFWSINPYYAPTRIHIQNENNSALSESKGPQRFMVFRDEESGMMTVAELIKIRGGDAGTWFDNIIADQKKYDAILDTIIPRYCNEIEKEKSA